MRLAALLLLAAACTTIKVDGDAARWADLKAFPYDDWAAVLSRSVNDQGRVDYDGLLRERGQLDQFVAMLGDVGPGTTPDLFPTDEDRLAYWINAYNAVTLHQIVHRWPVESVGDMQAKFFFWTRYRVDGKKRSLLSIENSIIRKRFDEPRIHFAVNCGSLGCPQLPREPFLPKRLEAQLARETSKFLGDKRNVELKNGTLHLSEIFSWYAKDFPPSPKDWVARQRPELGIGADTKVEYTKYDWTLNRR
ncbi:MAG: DUF547 domain-containing protein [Planctomycetota bacterium]|jgi:hypothetical protein